MLGGMWQHCSGVVLDTASSTTTFNFFVSVVLDDEQAEDPLLHPGQVHVARHRLPPGHHRLRVPHPRHHQNDQNHPRICGEEVQTVQQRPHTVGFFKSLFCFIFFFSFLFCKVSLTVGMHRMVILPDKLGSFVMFLTSTVSG